MSRQKEGKAYILLYACSLTRGSLLGSLTKFGNRRVPEKHEMFIARRGRPQLIYFDNGRTFVGDARWIMAVMKDERLQNYLSVN